MAPVPPAPVIEGALKSTINAIGFGLITSVLFVTFGKYISPQNYFLVIVSFVVLLEVFLLIFLPKRKDEYEVYKAPTRKVVHNIGGGEVPQISVQGPDGTDGAPKKKHGIRDRLKKDPNKPGKKDQLGVGGHDDPDGATSPGGRLSPKRSPKVERKAQEGKGGKEDEGKGKPENAQASETESKGKGKVGWRKRLTSKSSEETP